MPPQGPERTHVGRHRRTHIGLCNEPTDKEAKIKHKENRTDYNKLGELH